MKVNRLALHLCNNESCSRIAIYEFTDLNFVDDLTIGINDNNNLCSYNTKKIVIGYSCENHVEEVNKMLKDN